MVICIGAGIALGEIVKAILGGTILFGALTVPCDTPKQGNAKPVASDCNKATKLLQNVIHLAEKNGKNYPTKERMIYEIKQIQVL